MDYRGTPPSAGVIGWPVAHSKSPIIHRFWLGKLGLDGDYGRFPVHPDDLGAAIAALSALGLRGVNVTVPHKQAVIGFLDGLDASAAAIGAVNCVQVAADGRLMGYNTDIDGILAPIVGLDLDGRSVTVVGAGGAARAALAALQQRRVGNVTVINRTLATAQALLDDLKIFGEVVPHGYRLAPAALLINASSLGMARQAPLEIDLAALGADVVVFDCVYAPLCTPLLAAAAARGLRTIDGLQMLVEQAAAAFELFFGAPPPREYDGELRALLTA